jgi:hypothetical protein
MAKISDKELEKFFKIYCTQDKASLKKMSGVQISKYVEFLKHITGSITTSNQTGYTKTKEHTDSEIIASLSVLYKS